MKLSEPGYLFRLLGQGFGRVINESCKCPFPPPNPNDIRIWQERGLYAIRTPRYGVIVYRSTLLAALRDAHYYMGKDQKFAPLPFPRN